MSLMSLCRNRPFVVKGTTNLGEGYLIDRYVKKARFH